MMTTDAASASTARNLVSGLYVAWTRARETGEPYALLECPALGAGSGTVTPARSAGLWPGFEPVAVVQPGQTPEDVMGLCKSLATARQLGGHVAESILETLGPHLSRAARAAGREAPPPDPRTVAERFPDREAPGVAPGGPQGGPPDPAGGLPKPDAAGPAPVPGDAFPGTGPGKTRQTSLFGDDA